MKRGSRRLSRKRSTWGESHGATRGRGGWGADLRLGPGGETPDVDLGENCEEDEFTPSPIYEKKKP